MWLLDAYALIYRAYFAFSQAKMTNSAGLNTSAIYGFTNTLYDVLSNKNPNHIAVVFDTSKPTVRHVEYSEYKANREAMPDDIRDAIPFIKDIIKSFKIPIIFAHGYEADDIIGTLAKKAEREGYLTYMMTPDKDFGQLVSDNIIMYRPPRMGNKAQIWDVEEVKRRFEVEDPIQVIDYLGMRGDAVDNIPGIPGVGDKTAKKFIKEYGSLEGLLENVDKLKGKMKERVIENREQALLSKKLATIIVDAPIEFNPDELIREPMDQDALEKLFAELEFRGLSKRVLGKEPSIRLNNGQMNLFAGDDNATKEESFTDIKSLENTKQNYILIDSEKAEKDLLNLLSNADTISFDTETTGLNISKAELVGISFSIKAGEAYYKPLSADFEKVKKELAEYQKIFNREDKTFVAHNLKYDLSILKKYDFHIKGKVFDTMIAHYLLQTDQRHNLDTLAENYLGYKMQAIEELIGKKGRNQKSMRDIDVKEATQYAGEDADITLQLKAIFEKELEKYQMRQLFDEIEMPLVEVLAEMEQEGIKIDIPTLEKLSKALNNELIGLQASIFKLAGQEFNIDSPKQLGIVLFDDLKIIEKAKKTKSGQYSTSEDTLSKIYNKHEIVPLVLEYRSVKKLKSTYVDSLPELIDPKTDRIHTTYMQTVTATGRLSSTSPNLQNIPIRTERGRKIRAAFVAKNEDYQLLAADYSQIELRIIAALSKDESMLNAFRAKEDIHAATAAKVFEVKLDQVDRDLRDKAKTVNFGIIYGISPFGLSQRINISRTEAKEIIDSYFEKYPNIKAYMDNNIVFAKKHGYVETIMKRRRYLPDINSRNAVVRGFAERNAINAPIQGSAADVIKKAMIDIHTAFKAKQYKSKLLLQVHDELVFDVHKDELYEIKTLIKEKMENAVVLVVSLIVEIDHASNWLDAH